MDAGQQVKGAGLVGLVKLLKKRGVFDDVLANIEQQERDVLAQRILPTSWYPYDVFHSLLVTLDQIAGQGDGTFAYDVGKLAARMDQSGIYKKLGSRFFAEDFSEMISRTVWKSYYRPGEFHCTHREEANRSICEMSLSEFKPLSAVHCANIAGWIAGFFASGGCQNTQVDKKGCQCEGDSQCLFVVSWDAGTP